MAIYPASCPARVEQRADDGSAEFDRCYRAATGRVAFG